jgi:hypothetical protein
MHWTQEAGSITGTPRIWLRLEALAVLATALFLYSHAAASWVVFGLLFLAPDLSMLGYLAGPEIGAMAYNIAHNYVLPLILIGFALLTKHTTVTPYALIWIAHIAVDRMLGYGLKYGSSFGHTHLGRIGKEKLEEVPRSG